MEKKDLKIVYMGTPDFAVESLKQLVDNDFNVVGVVTMPDKPSGRGQHLNQSAVKQYAVEHGLHVMQPEKLKAPEFVDELKSLNADLQIVVAFRMLPEVVWNMPRLGTFNLHASLLPQYRGAAPINWAIINGDKETGITTFFLQHEIDTGEIIQQVKVPIADDDNVEIVHDKLMMLGGELVIETVNNIISGNVKPIPQDNFINNGIELRPAPKIFKDTCHINWINDTISIYNLIRGLSPYPAAWCELDNGDNKNITIKIFKAEKEITSHNLKPGYVVSDGKRSLKVATNDGYISILSLQPAGKRRMNIDEYLRGYHINENALMK